MPKITILGSCRYSPYKILATPKPTSNNYHNEEGYQMACKKFYPAIKESDEIWVYTPDGTIGNHTQRDLEYARINDKKIFYVISEEELQKIRENRLSKLVEDITC